MTLNVSIAVKHFYFLWKLYILVYLYCKPLRFVNLCRKFWLCKAMKILRSRLYERMQQEQNDKIASERRMQVGTGDRSERIRTYNFPQGRMTDHRIGLTLYRLEDIMNGNLDEVFDALATADELARLAGQQEEA